ncbi:MAG: hypothetical protein V9E87_10530 [Gemmatimonadales bacterium]
MHPGPEDFDHRWLATLTAKHRVVFDAHVLGDAVPLVRANNFLNACRDAYGAAPGQAQVVVALHAAPMVVAFNDAAWEKYAFGERARLTDPKTGKSSLRNLYASEDSADPFAAVAVPALQRRGAIFLFCNNVLRNLVSSLARRRSETPEVVRTDLIASFLPGVVLVPAVVAGIAMAQEHGCAYELLA